MTLTQCLTWWRPAPPRRAVRPAAPDWVEASNETAAQVPDETERRCGWFDSSHELHAGLLVTEHLTPERVANEVPLGWWLDWQSSASLSSGGGEAGLH